MALLTRQEVIDILQLSSLDNLTLTGSLTSGSAVVAIDTTSIKAGDMISNAAIPAGTLVQSIDSPLQLTMDDNATADDASASIIISDRGTQYDAMIDYYIPIVEEFIKQYCNNQFVDDAGSEDWPDSLKLPAAQMVYKNITSSKDIAGGSVQSETFGRYSVTYASGLETSGNVAYPQQILAMLNMYRYLRVV